MTAGGQRDGPRRVVQNFTATRLPHRTLGPARRQIFLFSNLIVPYDLMTFGDGNMTSQHGQLPGGRDG